MIRFLAIVMVAASMTGCLFVVDSKQKSGNAQWTNNEVDSITTGRTSSEWVRSSFGAPDRVSTYDNGTEVWRYHHTSESESRVGLFLLFKVNIERESTETLALEMRDGVVSDYWIEKR